MTAAVRILVIGVGSIGERHVRCFQRTGRAEMAICEPIDVRRQTIAQRYHIGESFRSLDEALHSSASFDAAVVCTPADRHVDMSLRLAAAGIHLLIEKPLGTSYEDVDRLGQIVDERQIIAGVAYVYRQHPSLAAMRGAIREGRFGHPVQIVATCGQHFPTYRPAYRETYYAQRETGGGAIQDALTHIVNAGQWLVGPVDYLVADAQHQVLPGVSVEDTVHVLTRQQAVMGNYSLNQHQAPNEVTVTVVCEDGAARFEYHRNRWRWMRDPGGAWQDEPGGAFERDELFTNQAHRFLDCLADRCAFSCTLQEAAQTLRTTLAIFASLASRTWQDVSA